MMPQANTYLLTLLLKAYNRPVKDFYYFPDIIYVGSQLMDPEDFFLLVSEGYLQQTRRDSFGRFYGLTDKARHLLHHSLHTRHTRKNKKEAPRGTQGSFCFAGSQDIRTEL